MKKLYFIYFILSLFIIGCSENYIEEEGAGTLTGTVKVQKTNEALKDVKITTSPSTETVYSDEEGNFEIRESIPVGEYSVRAEKSGYVTEFKAIEIKNFQQVVTLIFEMVTDKDLNQPPQIPQLISPEENAIDLPSDVLLKWEGLDEDEDELTYKVILSNNSTNQETVFSNLKVDTLALKDLNFGTTYTWQVVVSDSINDDVYSKSRQFTIRKNPEYRYHFVRKKEGNFIIIGTNLEDEIAITTDRTSSWRPRKNNTANKLAFLQTIGGETHLVTSDLNGENPRRISQVPVNGFRSDQLDFDWHEDGSKLIFPSFQKLYKVNHDGTGQHKIYETANDRLITKVAWSYDGTKIAALTNDKNGYEAQILILDGNGNYLETIFEGELGAVGGLDWNITGDKLVFTHDVTGYTSENYRQLDSRMMLYNFNDNSLTDLSSDSNKPTGTNDFDPQFSPNNAEIFFTNTSNDQISEKTILKIEIDTVGSFNREEVIINGEMPDFK